MITITNDDRMIAVKGHANYRANGEDIVCAAVSTLLQTLVMSIEELTADRIIYRLAPGDSWVKHGALSEGAQLLKSAFLVAAESLAETYPDNVRVSGRE